MAVASAIFFFSAVYMGDASSPNSGTVVGILGVFAGSALLRIYRSSMVSKEEIPIGDLNLAVRKKKKILTRVRTSCAILMFVFAMLFLHNALVIGVRSGIVWMGCAVGLNLAREFLNWMLSAAEFMKDETGK